MARMLDARAVAVALGGDAYGRNVVAPGPGHSRRDRSMSVTVDPNARDGFHVNSFAKDSLAECRAYVRRAIGGASVPMFTTGAGGTTERDPGSRLAAAKRIWRDTLPVAGTPVEAYLRSRGILAATSPALGFHRALRHPTGRYLPGMVAVVTDGRTGAFRGVHRTFLAVGPDGLVRKAPVKPDKMMLGSSRGGGVRLGFGAGRLVIGEGIETTLSVMQVTGLPGLAALSTGGLRSLELPEDQRDIVILADGDRGGEEAAVDAAGRWKREGRTVRIARPPPGKDFNDMLTGSGDGSSADTECLA